MPLVYMKAKGQTNIPDSLLTKDHIYEYTFSDQEKAKQIIQMMRERKLESEYTLDVAEGDLYFNNGKHNDALPFYTRALNSDSARNNAVEYMEQINRMISCYDALHDQKKKADYVKLLLDKAEETGNKEMKSIALFNMGKMIYYENDKVRGHQLIKQAIEEMKQSDYKYKYDHLRYNYNTLLMMQQRDSKFENALETLDALESVITESTNQEPNIEGLDEKEKKTMFAWRAVILSFLDRVKEADEAYKKWEVTGKNYTKDDYLIIPYLLHRKNFDKVIEIYNPRERFLYEQNDTINYHMKTAKRLLAKAHEGKKDYINATKYYKGLAELIDSLKSREQRSDAVELATVYETHEKEVKLQEQKTHIKVRNILLLSAGVAIFFLMIMLWRNIKHTRTIRNKNRLMATTIEDLLETKEKLNTLKENLVDTDVIPASDNYNSIMSEDQILFETLDNIVVREKLYLNPNLSREDLMKLIYVNKNRFGQILQQYSGMNTSAYINNKRLEYAAKLLKIHTEYTIAAIADSCGIPNIPTFNRLFKARFGMTPAEFRDSLQNSSNQNNILS